MTVDIYAICPCGSGKKIKFCKCKESVGELDRVLKMVEGGQVVPALDRLASILQEHPDAAWALAIRGRLLLDLREYGSLEENAQRFIRLQPSNPLALTQNAAAQLFQGKVEQATESILEALTESGRNVDSFVLDVASVLAYSLAQQGVFLTARLYAALAMMASGYEGGSTAVSVLRQINSSATVNHLVKADPPEAARPKDVDWQERFDEAKTLLDNHKVVHSQSKFESLRRSCPNEPAVISGLLHCAIWRGDTEQQAALLRKLSECEGLDFEQRARYLAMSCLVDPKSDETSVDMVNFEADLDNVEELEMALTADSRFVALPSEMLSGLRTSEEEVSPRSAFQMIDRDRPESIESLPPVDEIPEAIALITIFGRQTDRDARMEVADVQPDKANEVRDRIGKHLGTRKLTEVAGDPLPLLQACQPAVAMIRFKAKPAEAEASQAELAARRMPQAIASAPLPLLDGKSLIETADDDSKRLPRTALMRVIENYDVIASKGENVIADVYRLAKLDPLPPLTPSEADVEQLGPEDLSRVDPTNLDIELVVYLLQRAQQCSVTPAARRLANHLIENASGEEQAKIKLLGYAILINTTDRSEEALQRLEEAKAFAEQHQIPIANLLLSEVGLRLAAGDSDGFAKAIETLSTRHGNDPEVMAQLQQMLMAYGLIGPDGAPRTRSPGAPPQSAATATPAAAAPASGGLWTPDGGGAAADPSDGGEKKLWIPGMD